MPSSKSSRMLQTTSPLPRASSSTALDDSKNARTRQWLTRPLDRADLATGLHAVSERLQGADLAEDEWIVSLLSELRIGPASRLTTHIYANLPVNTSPPFATAQEQRILEAETKNKADI
ncbi:hypothetical protein BKA93DRAFT_822500 [Sparassis latifolia]